MGKLSTPFVMRDFHVGRYSPDNVGDFLCPENSVADCLNVNFDKVLGHVQVRGGQQVIGAVAEGGVIGSLKIGNGHFPVGATRLITSNTFVLLAALSGTGVGGQFTTIYYNDQTGDMLWHASDYSVNTGGTSEPIRFAQLNGKVFATLKGEPMYESADGITWTTNGNCIPDDIEPTLVYRYQGRLLAAGDPYYPSRIWVSSVVDLAASPFITWNIDPVNGDWIDVNPDDGGEIVGFGEASTFLLIFKDTGMYRTDDITSGVTPDNIFNVGAVSQECITSCQGVVYYYSGFDVRSTDGGYPQVISRAGIQDICDPGTGDIGPNPLAMGSDGVNVWLAGNETQAIVAKYSTRDQSWTVHQYQDYPIFRFITTTPATSDNNAPLEAVCWDAKGKTLYNAYWMTLETGYTDGAFVAGETIVPGTTFNYYILTQDVEFGSRAHQKSLSDKMIVFILDGAYSSLAIEDSNQYYSYPVPSSLQYPITILNDIRSSGFFFNFLWFGTSASEIAVFQGLEIEEVSDDGVNYGAAAL